MTSRVVIAGASIGGIRVASELRQTGYKGELILVDPDPEAPYDRPPLSKQVLLGTWEPARASLGDPVSQWGVDQRIAAATSIDPANRTLGLDTGEDLTYDTLVVATGASPRTLPILPAEGVHSLRTMADCRALRNDLARGGPLVVVGGGFIGAEVASTARAHNLQVTMIDPFPTPMYQTLGTDVGGLLAQLHTDHGVNVLCETSVTHVEGDPRVREVTLSDGRKLTADTVVSGIGVQPNTPWLNGSGLGLDNGLVCDQYCAADHNASIYTVGDVARRYDPTLNQHVRVEHWTNATEQAATVAHNIAHPQQRRLHSAIPYFWSDQHGSKIQLVGHANNDSQVTLIQGCGPQPRLAALYHNEDRLLAAVALDWPRALAAARRALATPLPSAQLLDKLATLA